MFKSSHTESSKAKKRKLDGLLDDGEAGSSSTSQNAAASPSRTSSEESNNSHHTDSSGHSSDHGVDPSKVPQILVINQVEQQNESFVINFKFNVGQRSETYLEEQGDHVTSYTLIIQALLASANTNLRIAIDSIKGLAQAMLTTEELETFNTIIEPTAHDHETRKKVRRLLENDPDLKDKAVLIDDELKYVKMTKRSQYLATLTTHLLEGLQQDGLTTVFSKGRIDKDPSEGVKAKTAARALVALNQIYYWAALDEEKFDTETVERILHALSPCKRGNPFDTEDQHVLRYGLSALKAKRGENTDGDVSADKLYREIKRVKSDYKQVKLLLEAVGEEFKEEVNKIVDFIGDLYDYRHKLTFDLRQAFPFSSAKTRSDTKNAIRYWDGKIKEIFNEKTHKFNFPSYEKIIKNDTKLSIVRTDVSSLAETIHRHFIIITSAFPELIVQIDVQKIKEVFIQNCVLNLQGWSEHGGINGFLSLDMIKKKLNKIEKSKAAPAPIQPGHIPTVT